MLTFFVENGSLSPPHLPVTDVKKKRKKKSKNKNLESTSLTNGAPNSKVCIFLYVNGNSTLLGQIAKSATFTQDFLNC